MFFLEKTNFFGGFLGFKESEKAKIWSKIQGWKKHRKDHRFEEQFWKPDQNNHFKVYFKKNNNNNLNN